MSSVNWGHDSTFQGFALGNDEPTVTTAAPSEEEEHEDFDDLATAGRETPGWIISLGVHVGILAALWFVPLAAQIEMNPIVTNIVENVDPEEYKLDATVTDVVGNDSQANVIGPSAAVATRSGSEQQKQFEKEVDHELANVEVQTDMPEEPHEAEMLERIPRTGSNVVVDGGTEGAVDRITMEIAGKLKDGKTLVVWLFDRSPSVNKRREEIADRFENVYRQLDSLNVRTDRALKTAVAAFGEKADLITEKPVDDYKEVAEAVRSIGPDRSGEENVFTATYLVANKFLHYRRGNKKTKRNVMIVIVTDEAGTDQQGLEKVISLTKRWGINVYVVGNASAFGRKTIEIDWERDGQTYIAEMETGPETIYPERLELPFWSASSKDLKEMSAGFGPWALTRLCTETNGLYLITENTRGQRFDPAIMRNYQPFYRSVREYDDEIKAHPTKLALILTAREFAKNNVNVPTPDREFEAYNDNILRQQITEAQRPFAKFDYPLQKIEQALRAGEKARKTLEEPRWRASFDLAMGRLLALRVRAYGYNVVLAEMKSSPKPFENPKSNHWKLVPSQEISAGPSVRKLAEEAEEYLRRVVDEHAGTPWAKLAARELSQPMGWAWKEAYVPQVDTGGRGKDGKDKPRVLFADDDDKVNKRRKPKKPPKPKRIKI